MLQSRLGGQLGPKTETCNKGAIPKRACSMPHMESAAVSAAAIMQRDSCPPACSGLLSMPGKPAVMQQQHGGETRMKLD